MIIIIIMMIIIIVIIIMIMIIKNQEAKGQNVCIMNEIVVGPSDNVGPPGLCDVCMNLVKLLVDMTCAATYLCTLCKLTRPASFCYTNKDKTSFHENLNRVTCYFTWCQKWDLILENTFLIRN